MSYSYSRQNRTGCLDLDEIMPTTDGQCTEGRMEPAGAASWEACAEERERGKEHNSSSGQKKDYSAE